MMNHKRLNTIFGENFKRLLQRYDIGQNDFAKQIGVTSGAVSQWANGNVIPNTDKMDAICTALHCTYSDLLLDQSILTPDNKTYSKSLPLYKSVSAGGGFFADSNVERYIAVDHSIDADYAVIVSGDSMINANIDDGDIAFMRKQFKFKEGNIYAIWQIGEELSYLKRVYIRNNAYFLVSENPVYEPLVLDNSEAFILGELVGLYKDMQL